jgi:hypothetical protein
LAFCVTAVLVTNSICWARFERASLGTYSLAALSWMFRHSKMPWDQLLIASVRVILRHHGITSGSLVIDDTDNPRSKAAKTLAYLYKLRDKESGGYLWGQSLVFLLLVTPKISIPVGFVFYQPAPELSAWYKQEKALKKQKVPKKQRPPKPAPHPAYPPKEQLALCLLEAFKAHHPHIRVHCIRADALYGTATFVDGASAMFGGLQVISQIRSNQNIRVGKREQHVADYFATHPGTPQRLRIRGGQEVVATVGSARLYVCAHHTKRFIVAIKYAEEERYRYLIASDLSCRAIQFSNAIPMRASACAGWAANRRHAAALVVWPAQRKSPMAVWRRAASTGGLLPPRPCERSSSPGTSRPQCDVCAIAQCPRTRSSTRPGVARSALRLVTPETTSTRAVPVFLVLPCRPPAHTGARPGQSLEPPRASRVVRFRGSRRPWPTSTVRTLSGRSPAGGRVKTPSISALRCGGWSLTLMT